MKAFNSKWPLQFLKDGALIQADTPDMGWMVFPYGDCVALVWYTTLKNGEIRWKPRRVKRAKALGGHKKFLYIYDLMTIKKNRVFEVTEKMREMIGIQGITTEEAKGLKKEKEVERSKKEENELIKKFLGG